MYGFIDVLGMELGTLHHGAEDFCLCVVFIVTKQCSTSNSNLYTAFLLEFVYMYCKYVH